MPMFTGGCVCGAVRYECDAQPTLMFKCHCHDCQHVSGGGYAPVVYLPKAAFHVTKGSLQRYATESTGMGQNLRGFCGRCGSRISGGEKENGIGILAGTLDDPTLFQPTVDIHVTDIQPWDLLDPKTTKFDGYPNIS